jgi:DNA-binding NarL/FixJ family response regulator
VLKGVPAADLQQAVRVVGEGGAWLDPTVTGRVLAVYRGARAPRSDDALAILTTREREVLALIGGGLTNAEIARELYVSAGTVKTHVHHIFTKLNLRNRAAAVIFALEHDLATRRTETE